MQLHSVDRPASEERPVSVFDGWLALGAVLLGGLVVLLLFLSLVGVMGRFLPPVVLIPVLGVGAVTWFISLGGFFTLQPNEAAALVLFGRYVGTVRTAGFHWTNPFNSKVKVSLRARNLNGEKLKVNDRRGNPIEIAAVVVWRVRDTAQALFDVDAYESFVHIQSESAVRHLASGFAYDQAEDEHEITLRAGGDQITAALKVELQERLGSAGVEVEEARLTHLAYAPEIAGAMLRRQQAEAILSARRMIVKGAVGMVEEALAELTARGVVDLDAERRAAMVSNLLVVLCGEAEVHPVVNAGSLYH